MTKVCHFSSVHSGLDIRIFYKECKSLVEAGHDVHLVITATEDEVDIAEKAGVKLHPVSVSSGRWKRFFVKTRRVYKLAKKTDADIYHFHDPELLFYGVLLKILGKKVIYDAHEDVPRDILEKKWLPLWTRHIIANMVGILEHVCAKLFFNVIAATPHIESRFKSATVHAVTIKNYPLPNELMTSACERSVSRNICYVGGILRNRGVCEIIEALPLIPTVRLILCGRFVDPGLEESVMAMPGWAQVDYRGHCDRLGVRAAMAETRIGMVTLLPTKAYVNSLPIKMFEYMSAGLAVIASDFPLWREILDMTNAGRCVDPMYPEAIAEAVAAMLDNPLECAKMGEAGRKAVLETYNWNHESRKLIKFYENL